MRATFVLFGVACLLLIGARPAVSLNAEEGMLLEVRVDATSVLYSVLGDKEEAEALTALIALRAHVDAESDDETETLRETCRVLGLPEKSLLGGMDDLEAALVRENSKVTTREYDPHLSAVAVRFRALSDMHAENTHLSREERRQHAVLHIYGADRCDEYKGKHRAKWKDPKLRCAIVNSNIKFIAEKNKKLKADGASWSMGLNPGGGDRTLAEWKHLRWPGKNPKAKPDLQKLKETHDRRLKKKNTQGVVKASKKDAKKDAKKTATPTPVSKTSKTKPKPVVSKTTKPTKASKNKKYQTLLLEEQARTHLLLAQLEAARIKERAGIRMFHDASALEGDKSPGPVHDQGGCGSCYAHSAAILARCWTGFEVSTQQAIDCSGSGCSGGWPADVFSFWANKGMCKEPDYSGGKTFNDLTCKEKFTGQEDIYCKPTDKCKSDVKVPTVSQVFANGPEGKGHNPNLEADLTKHKCIGSTIYVDDSFKEYKKGVYDLPDLPTRCDKKRCYLDHAITIVGMGTDGKDFWKLQNSFGPDWGENGFMRIVRGKGINMAGVETVNFVPA